MLLLSHFRGIWISMNWEEQDPPHLLAEHAGHRARVDILRGCITAGSLPNRQLRLVLAWTEFHHDELKQDWELGRGGREPTQIEGFSSGELTMGHFPQVVLTVVGEGHTVRASFFRRYRVQGRRGAARRAWRGLCQAGLQVILHRPSHRLERRGRLGRYGARRDQVHRPQSITWRCIRPPWS